MIRSITDKLIQQKYFDIGKYIYCGVASDKFKNKITPCFKGLFK